MFDALFMKFCDIWIARDAVTKLVVEHQHFIETYAAGIAGVSAGLTAGALPRLFRGQAVHHQVFRNLLRWGRLRLAFRTNASNQSLGECC